MHTYPDLLRIRYDHISPTAGKRYFEDIGSYRDLFNQDLVVTEKLDGSQMAVGWKNDQPYVQGKNSHIAEFDKRKAYHGAWSWVRQNVSKIENLKGFLVFGEWLRVQHSLPYDDLPDWFLVFDVYDYEKKRFMNWDKVVEFSDAIGFTHVPELHRGEIKYDELPMLVTGRASEFSTSHILADTRFDETERDLIQHSKYERFEDGYIYMEGCVVKPIQNPKFDTLKKTTYWMNCAKLVNQEFLQEFEDDCHWTSTRMRENKLRAWYHG